jgi:hypothetical protein
MTGSSEGLDIGAIRARMLCRQRMHVRAADLETYDEDDAAAEVAVIIARAKKRQQLHDSVQEALLAEAEDAEMN